MDTVDLWDNLEIMDTMEIIESILWILWIPYYGLEIFYYFRLLLGLPLFPPCRWSQTYLVLKYSFSLYTFMYLHLLVLGNHVMYSTLPCCELHYEVGCVCHLP